MRTKMSALAIGVASNALAFSLLLSMGHHTSGASAPQTSAALPELLPELPSDLPLELLPELPLEPAVSDADVAVIADVICGEVGPHDEQSGRNVLQVIVNRAHLKAPHTGASISSQLITEATRRLGGVPQFATSCRDDGRAEWQKEIARDALRGSAAISAAEWISADTLWFRTHSGAHLWKQKRGWTRNIHFVGADQYHSFFDANAQARLLMKRY